MSIKFFGLILLMCSISCLRGAAALSSCPQEYYSHELKIGSRCVVQCTKALTSRGHNTYFKDVTNQCVVTCPDVVLVPPKRFSLGDPMGSK